MENTLEASKNHIRDLNKQLSSLKGTCNVHSEIVNDLTGSQEGQILSSRNRPLKNITYFLKYTNTKGCIEVIQLKSYFSPEESEQSTNYRAQEQR